GAGTCAPPPPAYQLYHIVAAFLFWSESLNPPLWGRMRGCENDLAITLTFAVVLVALWTEFKGSTVTPDGISIKSVAVRWRVDVYDMAILVNREHQTAVFGDVDDVRSTGADKYFHINSLAIGVIHNQAIQI